MAIDQKILVTVDAVIIGKGKENSILLIQRKNDPFKGKWALPGGFVENDEDLPLATVRELQEETGLQIHHENLEQLGAWGKPGRDPRGRTVTIAFVAEVNMNDHQISAADDADDVKWWPLEKLPEIAFDHREILESATLKYRRLVSKQI